MAFVRIFAISLVNIIMNMCVGMCNFIKIFKLVLNFIITLLYYFFNITDAAINYFKLFSAKNFTKWVTFNEILIN